MRPPYVFAIILCLLPVAACGQLTAGFGARGEITELRVRNVVYFTDVALSIIKPGWNGSIVDQRAADPSAVKIEKRGSVTVYAVTLTGEGGPVKLRETVKTAADRLTVEYEVTPGQDMTTECILLQGLMPASVHAGKTGYLVADVGVTRGMCPAELNRDSYLIFGGRAAEWAGFTGPEGSALRVIPKGLILQFQDNRKWNVPGFGLLAMGGIGKLSGGKTIRFAITYSADTAAKLDADAREKMRYDLAGLKMSDDRPLRIRSVTADRQTVETFDAIELTADISATYDNPFDPDQIAVDAEVTAPDGRTATIPGFYHAPMRLETKLNTERLHLAGSPGFRVRYTPTTPGKYRVLLKITDRSGTAQSSPISFTATKGRTPGFVRVAKDSPHYFRFDDGRSYFAVGENVCWSGPKTPLADYTAWFKGLGAAGGNWARLWLAYNEKGLEWMPAPTPKPGTGTFYGLGRYAQDNAWRLDEIVRLARENGIYVMFCLGTYGEFTEGGYFNEGCWISNPYNAKNGGPCAGPEDFWTNPQARKFYKQRLRYLIARWGYSPNLFAWEFWNEVPANSNREAWVAEMAAYLKQHDPNRHLVSTTYGSPQTWRCPDVDFSMQHMYGTAGNVTDFTPQITHQARAALPFGKPYLLAEFGIDWQTGDNRWDPKGNGLNMHNGAWASVMSGAAGTSMLWYWDGYVHPLNLYHVLTPVRKFADTVDWSKTRFTPITGIGVEFGPGQPETFHDMTVPATVEWGATPSSEYTVLHDGTVQGEPVAMTIGSPKRGNPGELHTKLTWHLDLRQPEKVTLKLGRVCSRARMVVSVDGAVKVDRELTTGEPGKGPWKSASYLEQYKVWTSDYDEDIPLDIPAGKHDIVIANADGDWLQIRSLTLPAYRSSRYPDVNVLGLQSKNLLLLWVHNRESTWRTAYDGRQPTELKSLRISVPSPADGTWRVEWWDTFKGAVLRRDTARAKDGRLLLTPPDFARDLAVRCDKL
jgi:hypothetical protein